MARRSSRHGLSKKELEKQANESFSSTDDEEKRDKELFAATYIIEIIIYATYLVLQFENKYYFDANIKSKIR